MVPIKLDTMKTWQGGPDDRVDLEEVGRWLLEASRRFSQLEVVADPWQGIGLVQSLQKRGVKSQDVSFSQQYRNRIFQNMLELIRTRKITCYPHVDLKKELLQLEFVEKGGV